MNFSTIADGIAYTVHDFPASPSAGPRRVIELANVSCALFTLFPLAIPIISIENIARKSTKNSMIYINVFAGVLLNFLLALFNIFFLPPIYFKMRQAYV